MTPAQIAQLERKLIPILDKFGDFCYWDGDGEKGLNMRQTMTAILKVFKVK